MSEIKLSFDQSNKWVQYLGTLIQRKKGPKVWFHEDVKCILHYIIEKFFTEIHQSKDLRESKAIDDKSVIHAVFDAVDKNLPYHMSRIVLGAVEAHADLIHDITTEFDNPSNFYEAFTDTIVQNVFEEDNIFDHVSSKLDDYFLLIAYHLRQICKTGHGITAQHIVNIITTLDEPVEGYTLDNGLVNYGEKQYGLYDGFSADYASYAKRISEN